MRVARPYQDECVESIRSAFKQGKKGVVAELFTGAGKGYVIAKIAKMTHEKGGRVAVFVNRDNLCEQLHASLKEQGMFPVMERGMDKASPMSETVVGSIQSLQGERLKKWQPSHFKLVITDEVHFSAAPTFKRVLDHFASAHHIGFTATVARHDKAGLWKGYQDRVFAMPLTEGISHGWLVPFEFVELPVPIIIEDRIASKKRFTEEDEVEVFSEGNYLPRLFAEAAREAHGFKSLFFWPNCDSSKEAATHFNANGIESRHIDGYISRNEQNSILEWFKHSKHNTAMHNADLCSYGYDNPSINCIGVMRLSRSLPMLKQRLGRGTRPIARVDDYATAEDRCNAIAESDKPKCKVLDLMLQLGTVQNSFATPTDLVTEDDEEREFLRKERKAGIAVSLDELDGKLKAKRETDKAAALAKLAEDAANAAERKRDRSSVYIGDILRSTAEGDPATPKQIGFCQRLGCLIDFSGINKSQASRIIGRYLKAKEMAT